MPKGGILRRIDAHGDDVTPARADNDLWMKLVELALGGVYPSLFAWAKSSSALACWP